MLFLKQKSGKMMQCRAVCQGGDNRGLCCCVVIALALSWVELVSESVMWRCSLNPRCTPTGLCHSLRVRVAAALSVCSHSICIYLVLSA